MSGPRIDGLDVAVYTVPTEQPESDATLTWTETTLVVTEPRAGGVTGLGFTYAIAACATLIRDVLARVVVGADPMDVPRVWADMVGSIRNLGRPGVASMAIAAVDTALWDLKAQLLKQLKQLLCRLLGMVRTKVPVYGSGGFTSLTEDELLTQLTGWAERDRIPSGEDEDRHGLGRRPRAGPGAGRPGPQSARRPRGAVHGRQRRLPPKAGGPCWPAAGRAGRDLVRGAGLLRRPGWAARGARTVRAGRVRRRVRLRPAVFPADDRRRRGRLCAGGRVAHGGVTEWLRVAALAAAHNLEVSAHCAQSLTAHPATAVPNLRHLEYFHDHARVDRLLFDGVLDPTGGALRPDLSRPGTGLTLRRADAERYRTQ
jgi:hypothetical protein